MKVAIVGTAPSSRLLAPYSDPEWQCWLFSPDNVYMPHIDVWFDIHGDYAWPNAPKWEARYLAWMCAQKFPVYVQRTDLVPNGIPFPAKELIDEFGQYWFTSSVAWLMAFALKQGATELGIYGVDMTTKDEYLHQRPGVYYWMELATKRGVRVYVPPESDLLSPPPLYGYSETTPMGRKLRVRYQEMTSRLNELNAELKRLESEKHHLIGALDDNEYSQIVWTGDHRATTPDNFLLEK
jgi:hypothetical protein